MSYEEEDTCVSYEVEDTCVSYEEEGHPNADLSFLFGICFLVPRHLSTSRLFPAFRYHCARARTPGCAHA